MSPANYRQPAGQRWSMSERANHDVIPFLGDVRSPTATISTCSVDERGRATNSTPDVFRP